MNKISIGVLALVVGVIIGAGVMQVTAPAPLGGVTQEDETFKYDVDVEGTLTAVDVATTDDLTVAKDLILTDNDFCINFYATSTATQNKMYASSTATIEAVDGVMMFGYGSCVE